MTDLLCAPPPVASPDPGAVSRDLMELVLKPYLPDCRYMKGAFARCVDTAAPSLVLEADFRIPSSCYIDSTGHFNAVESNICVNQMSYLLFAWFVQEPRRHAFSPTVGAFDLSTFRQKQLPNMWILSLQTSFRKAINAHHFRGRLEWTGSRRLASLLLLNMSFEFSDDARGRAAGSVQFAVT